jgi:hypothetical protein
MEGTTKRMEHLVGLLFAAARGDGTNAGSHRGTRGQSTLYKFISLPTGMNPPEPLKGSPSSQTQFRSNKRDEMALRDAMKAALKTNRRVGCGGSAEISVRRNLRFPCNSITVVRSPAVLRSGILYVPTRAYAPKWEKSAASTPITSSALSSLRLCIVRGMVASSSSRNSTFVICGIVSPTASGLRSADGLRDA